MGIRSWTTTATTTPRALCCTSAATTTRTRTTAHSTSTATTPPRTRARTSGAVSKNSPKGECRGGRSPLCIRQSDTEQYHKRAKDRRRQSAPAVEIWGYPASSRCSCYGYPVLDDYCNYNASGVVLYVGGNYNQNQNHGAFYLNGNNAASNANANIGCRHLANGLRQSAHFSVRPFPRLCIDGRDSRAPLGEERCRRDAV